MPMTGEIKWEYFNLPNIPIYQTKLPQDIIDRLWGYIDKATEKDNKALAGNIDLSLKIKDEDDFFMKYVLDPIAKIYLSNCGTPMVQNSYNNKPEKLLLNKFWVNFQKQHEFNPLHKHGGVFSFVIWMKIPTDYKEQHALPISANSNAPCASNFQFVYSDVLGRVQDYQVVMHEEQEGWMLLFPSELKHQVYPFYNCDEQRVSISGNVSWDV